MKTQLSRLVVVGLMCITFAACQSEAEKKLGGDQLPPWPELDALNPAVMAASYPLARGSVAEAAKAAAGDEFAKAVANFEKSAVPSGFKAADKDAVVAALQEIIKAGKAGNGAQLKSKLDALGPALNKLTHPEPPK